MYIASGRWNNSGEKCEIRSEGKCEGSYLFNSVSRGVGFDFLRQLKFRSWNIFIMWLMVTLRNKHESDVNESIILALIYKDDYVKQDVQCLHSTFL